MAGTLKVFSIVVPANLPRPPNILYGPQSLVSDGPLYTAQPFFSIKLLPSEESNDELVKD